MSVLVVTAVPAEADAVRTGLRGGTGITVAMVGVGPVRAAVTTYQVLTDGSRFTGVICAGVGGGFAGRVPVGGVAVATSIVSADLGAEDGDRFIPLEELGFGVNTYRPHPGLLPTLPDAVEGAILTVSTVTGSATTAARLADRYPDAVAEGMEGYGVAGAATAAGVPFAEVRTISNAVGPRDREAWRLESAFEALTQVAAALR